MAKLCRYDEAIECYTKGYDLQPHPKYSDSLIAISHIYEIQREYEKSIEKIQEILLLMKNDWDITECKMVDFYKREIERLKMLN